MIEWPKRSEFRHEDGTTFPPLMGPPGGPPPAVSQSVSLPSAGLRPHGGGNGVPGGSYVRIREILRFWMRGQGLRSIKRLSDIDRKTVRRYVSAAIDCGVDRLGGEEQVTDTVLAVICETVRPHRPRGRGEAWEALAADHDDVRAWLVDDHLTVVKAGELLARRGVVVPERTLHRYTLEVLGVGRFARGVTVRVADGEPGSELQVEFGRMGLLFDSVTGRRRVCWALIFRQLLPALLRVVELHPDARDSRPSFGSWG